MKVEPNARVVDDLSRILEEGGCTVLRHRIDHEIMLETDGEELKPDTMRALHSAGYFIREIRHRTDYGPSILVVDWDETVESAGGHIRSSSDASRSLQLPIKAGRMEAGIARDVLEGHLKNLNIRNFRVMAYEQDGKILFSMHFDDNHGRPFERISIPSEFKVDDYRTNANYEHHVSGRFRHELLDKNGPGGGGHR
ncbi:MAG: hypothetical protein MPK62_00135 [Alphaproteobacteria bacterium]|nr:hypothetical protein [Alphaproteobacteria bacterium]